MALLHFCVLRGAHEVLWTSLISKFDVIHLYFLVSGFKSLNLSNDTILALFLKRLSRAQITVSPTSIGTTEFLEKVLRLLFEFFLNGFLTFLHHVLHFFKNVFPVICNGLRRYLNVHAFLIKPEARFEIWVHLLQQLFLPIVYQFFLVLYCLLRDGRGRNRFFIIVIASIAKSVLFNESERILSHVIEYILF